jgi:hypothetical protein
VDERKKTTGRGKNLRFGAAGVPFGTTIRAAAAQIAASTRRSCRSTRAARRAGAK